MRPKFRKKEETMKKERKSLLEIINGCNGSLMGLM